MRELPDFVDLAADIGADYVLVQDFKVLEPGQEELSLYFEPELAASSFRLAQERARERSIMFSTFQPTLYLDSDSSTDCFDPWECVRIGENGDVFPCCYSEHVMGNVLRQSLDEVWNGNEFREYRRRVNTDDPPKECRSCVKKTRGTQFRSYRWHRESDC